ncbi:MAG: hypothetical protein IPG55_04435 [Saprospiraceae bacterium]|nr:hypothetical protein [Candidatus Defluviibacterium haderslevense]MBK7244868.1 hypothetical protein [Candidatus Defluviibacterium haderslevense]
MKSNFDPFKVEVYKILLLIALILSIYIAIKGGYILPYFIRFIFISVLIEIIVGPFFALKDKNNVWLYNLMTIMNNSYYSYLLINGNSSLKSKKVFYICILCIIILGLSNYLYLQGPNIVNTYTYHLSMFFVSGLIIYYLKSLIENSEVESLIQLPLFWISIGILFFYASSFPLLIFMNQLIASKSDLVIPLYNIVQFANIFLSLSYIIALVCPYLKTKQFIG